MEKEEQRPVTHPREPRTEAAVETHLFGFLADLLFDLLPLHAERRIGEHVVETLARQTIGGERVAEHDVGDVLPLDEHVRLADSIGLGVQFLAVHDQASVGVQFGQMLASDAQHAAGPGRRVTDRAHDARFGEGLVVLDEEEIDHQPDHLARREMLARSFVRELGEAPDQLLEHRSHLGVGHNVGVQVDVREFLRY
jgi:hypothetical protein